MEGIHLCLVNFLEKSIQAGLEAVFPVPMLQWFEPRRRQYFKLLLDLGDFHSNPSGLLSFNKSETVLWTIAKILLLL